MFTQNKSFIMALSKIGVTFCKKIVMKNFNISVKIKSKIVNFEEKNIILINQKHKLGTYLSVQ